MNILTPFSSKNSLQSLLDAGADEIYTGFHDEDWEKEFSEFENLNHLSGMKPANENSFEDILQVIDYVKNIGKKIYITFNANVYSDKAGAFIERYFEQLANSKIDGVIITDAQLISKALKYNLVPVASSLCSIYNQDVASFYINQGVKRIILPRDVTTGEISSIVKANPQADYEVFLMRNGCIFSDNYCLGMHRMKARGLCQHIRDLNNEIVLEEDNFKTRHDAGLNNTLFKNKYIQHFSNNACGLCAIYRLIQTGISAVKVVGRPDDWQSICADVKLIRTNIDIAETCESEKEYLRKMIFPPDRAGRCALGLTCYFPEVRFQDEGMKV